VGAVGRWLGWSASAALAVIVFSPLGRGWLAGVSGLTPELADFALLPVRLLVLLPAMEYWLSFQRSRFILSGQTRIITMATACEVAGIAAVLAAGISWFQMAGAVAGSVAQIAGRLAANLFLAGATAWATRPSGPFART
jgi:progressive ankylosis protein